MLSLFNGVKLADNDEKNLGPSKKNKSNFLINLLGASPMLALPVAGIWFAGFFFKGSPFIWLVWLVLGGFFIYQIVRLIPIPEGVKKAIGGLLSIAILIGAGVFLYAGWQTGGWKELVLGVERTGAEQAAGTTATKLLDYVKNPGRLFSDFSDFTDPSVKEKDVKRGVEIYDLTTRRESFEESSEVIIRGSAKVSAFDEKDSNVKFGCYWDEDLEFDGFVKEGSLRLIGYEGSVFTVYAGHDEIVDFECKLKGLQLDIGEGLRSDDFKDSRTFIAKINGDYEDFSTTSILKVYNLKKEELDLMEDPWDGIIQPLKGRDDKLRSECELGCGLTRLSLKTSKQPQTEVGGPYPLDIALKRDSDWYGEISNVERIEVRVPDNFQLKGCQNFGSDAVLDMNDLYLAEVNEERMDGLGSYKDILFFCDYDIIRPMAFMQPSEISVDAVYDYTVELGKAINIVEKKVFDESTQDFQDFEDEGVVFDEEDTRYLT